MSWHRVPVYLKLTDKAPHVHVRFTDDQVAYLRQGLLHVAWCGPIPPPSYEPELSPVSLAYEKLTFYKEWWRSDEGQSTYRIVFHGRLEALEAYARRCDDAAWYEYLS